MFLPLKRPVSSKESFKSFAPYTNYIQTLSSRFPDHLRSMIPLILTVSFLLTALPRRTLVVYDLAALYAAKPIPLTTAKIVQSLFYPSDVPHASDPTLCRLYFGKIIQAVSPSGRPNRFFNSANFSLDVARYYEILTIAQQEDCEYPTVEEIAYGMGEALGRLHWCAGYNGRDVEFIMGGASFSGVMMNIIDFNQVCCCFKTIFAIITITCPRCALGIG